MKTKLLNVWESIRASFWFVPSIMVFWAVLLSFLMVAVDRRLDLTSYSSFGILYAGGPEGGRLILSTIAGSMVTVAGVAFSITIVALTLASSQFGSRLLRNFMRDTGNQLVLGTFISTFIYCLLVLRTVGQVDEAVFVPNVSITFAVVLALVNVGVLIFFIHHVSTSIQADQVIAAVYHELLNHIQRLFPEEIGYGPEHNEKVENEKSALGHAYYQTVPVLASQSGYLQAIDSDGLLEFATGNDLLMYLQYRPGEFVVAGSTIVAVQCNEPLDENLKRQISGSLILGTQRTPEQDSEYVVHQLVEVAVRALSPGINDPFTAISCIDRLGSAICHLTDRAFPSPYRYDDQQKLRIIAKPITFEGITNAAFDQIRQYGQSSVAVTIRLLETLQAIAHCSRNREQRQTILRQANMIERASHEAFSETNDKQDVQERYQALIDLLNEEG